MERAARGRTRRCRARGDLDVGPRGQAAPLDDARTGRGRRRALARTEDAPRARRLLATAEATARRAKQEQLRWPQLVGVAEAYLQVGALEDARRIALEADRGMLDRSDPCGAIEYVEIAAVLH